MTNEEIECKATELSVKHGVKVHPLIFAIPNSEEKVIGYLKEPPRAIKLRVMDKGLTEPVTAASVVVDAYIIREESDPRILSEASENDVYYMGACMEAYSLIQLAINQFKKK